MIKTRAGIWNDIYSVSGLVKPNAYCSEIFNSFRHTEFSSKDIVILSFGSHDKNPYFLFTQPCNALNEITNCQVLILNVQSNTYIFNVDILNSQLKLLLHHYSHCKIINLYRIPRYHSPLKLIYRKFNMEIDYLSYREQYIVNGIKIAIQQKPNLSHEQAHIIISTPHSPIPPYKKGTIPFYFNKLKITIKDNSVRNNSNINVDNDGTKVNSTFFREKG